MTFPDWNWPLFLPGLVLLVPVIDDLRSRKIHNKLILFLLPFVLLAVFFLKGLTGLKEAGFSVQILSLPFLQLGFAGLLAGGFSALLALLVGIPLALGRVIGGGDLKLLVLVAFTLSWTDLLWIFIYSLPWALLLGLVKITLDKKLKDFLFNVFFLFRHRTNKGLEFHSIPFSFALFMAWLSFLTVQGLSIP